MGSGRPVRIDPIWPKLQQVLGARPASAPASSSTETPSRAGMGKV